MEFNFEAMTDNIYQYLEKESKGETLILPAIVVEISPTRLHWKNVKEFLRVIRRNPDHFMDFLKHELTNKEVTWYSGSKSDGLIIHGKYQRQSDITDISLKYVNSYVVCPSCRNVDTEMKKTTSKLYEFECLDCGMKKNMN